MTEDLVIVVVANKLDLALQQREVAQEVLICLDCITQLASFILDVVWHDFIQMEVCRKI